MENVSIDHEIIQEMSQLLDKTAVESFAAVITDVQADIKSTEAFLISLKAINAKYGKNEAMAQVRALMEKYNIQIDEVLEQIKF